MKNHLQGFFATICGRYHGTHWNASIALTKPHSNLQLVREYSLWKRRLPDSCLNLHPLFFGDRLCMFRGHFPEPTTEWWWNSDVSFSYGNLKPGGSELMSLEIWLAEISTECLRPGRMRKCFLLRRGNSHGWPRNKRKPEDSEKTVESLIL